MSTGEDSSFEDSYEYVDEDDDSPEEFVDADIRNHSDNEESTVIVVELPASFQLSETGSTPPTEVLCADDIHDACSPNEQLDSVSVLSTPEYTTHDETPKAEELNEGGNLSSHFGERRASAQESISIGGLSSYNLSIYGSTMGTTSEFLDYELISLGGSTRRLCKRCTFIGNVGDCFCQSCGLAWSANPCVDLDAMIAAQLQFKEEESILDMIQKEEKARQDLSDQNESIQARVLTKDILLFVENSFPLSKTYGFILNAFSESLLFALVKKFILDYFDINKSNNCFSKVVLYYYVSSSADLAMIRRGDGFLANTELHCNLEEAYQAAKLWLDIGANSDNDVSYFGWIVAVSQHERILLNKGLGDFSCLQKFDGRWTPVVDDATKTSSSWTVYKGQVVLPLVYFDVSKDRNFGDRIINGLTQVCSDFFGCLQHSNPLSDFINYYQNGLGTQVEI